MAMFAAVAMLLGVMLTVVTGHVTGAARDWSDANFGLSSRASILVVQSGVDAELSSTVNSEALSLLTQVDATVIFEADDDGLGMGLYDSAGRYSAITGGGRDWRGDSSGSDVLALVREGSYLVGRESSYLPDSVRVLGSYDPTVVPLSSEYVYTLFRQETTSGTYFIDSADAQLAARLAAVFARNGYMTELAPLEVSVWSVIRSEPLSYAYLSALLLVTGSLILLCGNWAAQNRKRFAIHRMFGAHSGTYTTYLLPPAALAALSGSAVGIIAGAAALASLDSLSELPGPFALLIVGLGNGIALTGIFLATVSIHARRQVA